MNEAVRPLEAVGDIARRLGFPAQAVVPGPTRPELIITHFSDVEAVPVDWLWPGYIPAGMLTILDGDPGLGKSLLTIDLAARVSSGREMPFELPGRSCRPRGVVLLSAEDDPARTIRPRLDAAGADVRLTATFGLRERDGLARELAISPADLRDVENAIREMDVALLIIDPLMAYLPDTVNANRDQDVRRSLTPLADLAERTGAAVVAVRHLRKSGADSPIYRGGGSIGIIGAARSALLVARDPDDPTGERRILAALKSNLGPLPGSLCFRVAMEPSAAQPHITWEGETTHRAADLLAQTNDGERGPSDDAESFLRDLLADGPILAREVSRQSRQAGIAPRTLERAKGRLGIKSVRPDGFTGAWYWAFPETYNAKGGRTSPQLNVGDVADDLAMYGPDPL